MFDMGKKQNLAAMLRNIADKLDDDKAMPISIRANCEFGRDDLLAAKFEIDIAYIGDNRNSDYAEAMAALDQTGILKKGSHTGINTLRIMGRSFYIPKFAKCVAIDYNGEVWAYGHEKSMLFPQPGQNVWLVKDCEASKFTAEKLGDIGRVVQFWINEIYPVNQ